MNKFLSCEEKLENLFIFLHYLILFPSMHTSQNDKREIFWWTKCENFVYEIFRFNYCLLLPIRNFFQQIVFRWVLGSLEKYKYFFLCDMMKSLSEFSLIFTSMKLLFSQHKFCVFYFLVSWAEQSKLMKTRWGMNSDDDGILCFNYEWNWGLWWKFLNSSDDLSVSGQNAI